MSGKISGQFDIAARNRSVPEELGHAARVGRRSDGDNASSSRSPLRPATESAMPSTSLKRACLLSLSLLAANTAQAVPADAERAASPVPQLTGAWSWTDPAQCSETYEYRVDGSGSVQSGEERSEMAYVFDPKGSETGFYKLEATILKDHGGTDCAGSKEDDTNKLFTVYVKFNPEGDQHIVCVAPEAKQCFGPLRRTGAAR
jgi:hypothetical protein